MKDYIKRADSIKQELMQRDEKPRMLLHSCCGPCSTACIEYLKECFDLTVLFYNPNIAPREEYEHRAAEQARYVRDYTDGVKCEICDYDPAVFYEAAKGFEDCEEGGERCARCFDVRLDYTARIAKEQGFEWFCTTLTVSPHKNADLVNATGERKAVEYGVRFFPSDFKKKNGYLNSVRLAKEANLYRQNYCGCIFSLGNGFSSAKE